MPSPTKLINGHFQDAEGTVLANGYLTFELNQDESISGSSICAGVEIKILLDASGNVQGSSTSSASNAQTVWGTDVMSPVNAFYKVTGYTAVGQPVWGPNNQQITTGATFDLDTWVPNQVINWLPLVTLLLSTAPATSSSQGTTGQFAFDASFLYVCVALNTWKRVAISSF